MDTTMGQRLQRRLPGVGLKKVRLTCPSERADLVCDKVGRTYGYRMPGLDVCREAFEAQLGTKLTWEPSASQVDDDLGDLDEDVIDFDPLDETYA